MGIVGTRRPTGEGEKFAFDLAKDLSTAGVAIASGGALGIDTAAHQGALAGDSPSIVVAPSGLLCPYPAENLALFETIVGRGGAYLSLVPSSARAQLSSFFARNAALAALCDAVIIVQAPFRSGARNTAAVARRLGRLLLVVPGSPWEPAARGCIAELRLGGTAIDRSAHVLDALSARGVVAFPISRRVASLRNGKTVCLTKLGSHRRQADGRQTELFQSVAAGDESGRIVEALHQGCCLVESICAFTQLPANVVQSELLKLELDGVLHRDSADTFRLSRP